MAAKYKGRTTDHPEPWEEAFLLEYATEGGITLCAKNAGVTVPYVKRRAEASPAFAEKFDAAREEFCDRLERKMMRLGTGPAEKGNFLAYIARLKAERPSKYNDKLQVTGAIAHLNATVPPEAVTALLREMLGDATPETRAQIAGNVIDVTPIRDGD